MPSLSYQLYSSRNWPSDEAFALLYELGVSEVEGFGPYIAEPDKTRILLDEHGLKMPTAHVGLEVIENDPEQIVQTAKLLGIETIFVPFLQPDARPQDAAGWQAFADRLSQALTPLKAAGLKVGWHNHEFEFQALEDGSFPIDHIAAADSDLMLELDLAWIVVAEQDPVAWLSKYKGRVSAAHIKDIAPKGEAADEDGWADVGHGTLDWSALWSALQETTVARLVLEHDNPSDHKRFASRSVGTLRSWGV